MLKKPLKVDLILFIVLKIEISRVILKLINGGNMLDKLKKFLNFKEKNGTNMETQPKLYPCSNVLIGTCENYHEEVEGVTFSYIRTDAFLVKMIEGESGKRYFARKLSSGGNSEIVEFKPTINPLIFEAQLEENGFIQKYNIMIENNVYNTKGQWRNYVPMAGSTPFINENEVEHFVRSTNNYRRLTALDQAKIQKKTNDILNQEFEELGEDE